ncbi:MAG TPA: response regulator [Anaerolineae bacterium]|nr:response regulator [Anaerolineae bacterium]HQK12737.1 response regulator [Anaerolineae bacterium]
MDSSSHPENTVVGDILVVDDTPANLRLLAGMLSEQGYKVRPAPNGKLALMAARAAPPDLILLDINMPDMNGYEVCAALKDDPATRDIPVIFISALDQTEDKVKAFTLGGVDYVTKPFQIEEVLARVKTHLTLYTLQRQLATANRELRAANAELAASNADLNAFARTVAHDLKNPLSAVIGFSSLLEARFRRMEPEKIAENLHRITRTGYKMRDIIDELLLLANVRQVDTVQTGPLDMGAVVAEAMSRLELQIQETQASIVMPETWPVALGYAAWVEAVWANYIGNALKYGGDAAANIPPRVELGYAILDCRSPVADSASPCATGMRQPEIENLKSKIENPQSKIVFWVRDNGPGLTPEEQARAFTPFTRFHQEKAEGHGLGLSIVQRIVEKLGGQVGVESTAMPGEGCIFWFTLLRNLSGIS